MLENFRVARFELKIVSKEPLFLPEYKGSAFRGGFGYAFKRVVCSNREGECQECLLKEKCVYSYVFETPPPKETEIMRKYPAAPHPFIIEPPLDKKREFKQGEELTFGLVLVGQAIEYLPYFIFTFEELGRIGLGRGRGKYFLKDVKDEKEKLIYAGEQKHLKAGYFVFKPPNQDTSLSSSLTLHFLTPTRINYKEKLTRDLQFHILMRALLRRIYLLSYFHCDKDWQPDFTSIIRASEEIAIEKSDLSWYDWERYSSRQDTRMKLGGFVREITYSGDPRQFLPYLLLGEYTHVGKGATFGLGKYEIE